jgi:hypothetical protein
MTWNSTHKVNKWDDHGSKSDPLHNNAMSTNWAKLMGLLTPKILLLLATDFGGLICTGDGSWIIDFSGYLELKYNI